MRTSAVTATGASRGPVEGLLRPGVRWGLGHALPRTVMAVAARRGDLHGRLIGHGGRDDPAELRSLVDEARASGPLHRTRLGYITVSLPVVREVLGSHDFRTAPDVAYSGLLAKAARWSTDPTLKGPLTPPSLLVSEPPDHTRYRKLVTRVFSVRAVEALRGRTEQIAHDLLDQIDQSGTTDLVATYASLLPVTVITEILGVPAAERDRVLAYGSAAAPSLDLGLSWQRFRRVERALREFDAWLATHLEYLRRNPGEDLMSRLVAVRDAGEGLSEEELTSTAGLVLAAGFETTVNLLGNGVVLLREHPEQQERLTAEPGLWPNAVDEVLRIDPPVLLTARVATTDTTVAGTAILRHTPVTTLLAGANRDPAVFEDPHRFRVDRENARDHVAFSSGRHYCLGAALARLEGEVGLRVLLERYPDLRLEPGARRRDTRILRGYERLPVTLTP